jgi:hypothetical protein
MSTMRREIRRPPSHDFVAPAMALREVPIAGDVTALIVAALRVVASFLVAHPLVMRTRLGRII